MFKLSDLYFFVIFAIANYFVPHLGSWNLFLIEILYLCILQEEMKEILEKEKKEIWDEMQASLQVNITHL